MQLDQQRVEQLEKKKHQLLNNLHDESDATKRRRLKTNLKIVTLQLKKGNKLRDELVFLSNPVVHPVQGDKSPTEVKDDGKKK